MDKFKLNDCIEKIDKQNTTRKKLRLIYEWVKICHIDLKEFVYLIEITQGVKKHGLQI